MSSWSFPAEISLTNSALSFGLTTSLIIATVLLYYKHSFQYWKKRNVPHLEPTFPFGNWTNNVFNIKIHLGEILATTYETMKARGHRYCGLYLFNRPTFVPIDPEITRLILNKDFHNFPNRNLFYNEKDDPISAHLLAVNGKKWNVMRTKVTPIFTAAKLKIMFKIFIDCGKQLVKNLENLPQGEPFEAKEMFTDYSTDVIGTCAFGLELDAISGRRSAFKKYAIQALDFGNWRCAVMLLCGLFPRIACMLGCRQIDKESGDFFIKTVKDNVEYRESTNTVRNDFLQLLINLKHNKSLTGREYNEELSFGVEELAAQCFIFLLAGYETSATTMTYALFEISRNDQIAERIQEEIQEVLAKYDNEVCYDAIMEMKYLHQVVEETLRMYPPAYFVTRVCTEDYKIPKEDLVIEKGTQVMVSISGVQRDPEFYPEPDKFNPERFSEENKKTMHEFTYLPFGKGPRHCIGMRFGMVETKVALCILLRKFKFEVDSRTRIPLKFNPIAMLRDVEGGIWLRPVKI